MKEFSLEEYLENPERKIVTREGRSVRILCVDKIGGNFPIIALIQQHTRNNEVIGTFTKDGKWSATIAEQPNDLFFAPEKHEGWINIYADINDDSHPGNHIFESKEEAEEEGKKGSGYVTTIKIEWEK